MAVNFEDDDKLQHCSLLATRSLVQKKEDPRVFTIPCTIGMLRFTKVLCDFGASINLMPLSIYKKWGLGAPKATAMRLLMSDQTMKKLIVVLQDVLMKFETFVFSVDFLILDCEVDFEVPIILGRPFLATGYMKHESDLKSVSVVNHIVEEEPEVSIEERLGVEARLAEMNTRSNPRRVETEIVNEGVPPKGDQGPQGDQVP
ncbi:uncharacterized protein LOC125833049 [Solanum verrucosum]|uniref:uncharacterized protein LOC125833049 n=1 Tax=Solanum verrucosum TaxID=315347 RepID=UPI0020D1378E|nr:uncharacterized protein LOC125833049 [Solanum verrucosum]